MLYRSSRSKPRASNFELWSWFFMRVSGVVLLVMVLVHFAIMHLVTPIELVTFDFVALRWANPLWRLYDLVLLSLGVVHGMNGVRVVSDDYIHSQGWRVVVATLIYSVTFLFLLIGAEVIYAFQLPINTQ